MQFNGMSLKFRQLAGNSIIYLGGEVLTKGGYLLLIPLYTRYITPAENGILGGSLAVRNFITIVFYGLIINIITRFFYSIDKDERRTFFGTFWLLLFVAAIGTYLLQTIWGVQIFNFILRQIPYDPYGKLVVWTALLMVLSEHFGLSLLRIQEQASSYVLLSFLAFSARTGFTIYFVVFRDEQALGALKGEFLGAIVMFLPFILVIIRNISFRWSWKYFREIGKFGLPLIPHSIASWGLALSDRLILDRSVSLHDLGIYTLGRQFATVTALIVSAVANAWSPFFMKHIHEHEDRDLVVQSAMLFWGTISAIGLGIALVAPALIRIVAAPEYHAATTVVSMIALGYLAQGLYNLPANVLSYLKKTNRMALATGFGFTTSIFLNLILIPRYGILAAARNVAIAYVVMFIIAFALSYRSYIISYDWKRIAGFAFWCIAIYTITNFVNLVSPYFEAIVRGSIVSIGCLFAISFLMRVRPQEWMIFLRKVRKTASS